MESKLELRHLASAELRAQPERKLSGYAAMFNVLSEDIGGFREVIKPGAFRASLASRPVTALSSHDPAAVIGSTRSRTLELAEDARGLHFNLSLPDTTVGRDLHTLVARGDIAGMSFGFRPVEDRWPSRNLRELLQVILFEISVTAFPAYPQASVEARGRRGDIGSVGVYRVTIPDAADPLEVERLRLRLRLAKLL